MNNEIFPLPFPVHVLFVFFATAMFLLQHYRLHHKYLLIAACIPPLTMLTYVAEDHVSSSILSLVEVALLTVTLIFAAIERFRAEREKKKQEALEEQKAKESYTLEELSLTTDQESWSAEPDQDGETPSDQDPL